MCAHQPLGNIVIGRELRIGNGPGGGETILVYQVFEILGAEPQGCRTEELAVATDIVIGAWVEVLPVAVAPGFLRCIFLRVEDGINAPIIASRGSLGPRSIIRMLRPRPASWFAIAPPPTPAPMMTTS